MPSKILEDFAAEFERCWLCGVKAEQTWPPRLEIHHIVRGSLRSRSRDKRSCLIRTCYSCHARNLDGMGVGMQLAIKKLNDPDGYDRLEVNQLRGRAPESIDESEVLRYIAVLRDGSIATGYPFDRIR